MIKKKTPTVFKKHVEVKKSNLKINNHLIQAKIRLDIIVQRSYF